MMPNSKESLCGVHLGLADDTGRSSNSQALNSINASYCETRDRADDHSARRQSCKSDTQGRIIRHEKTAVLDIPLRYRTGSADATACCRVYFDARRIMDIGSWGTTAAVLG